MKDNRISTNHNLISNLHSLYKSKNFLLTDSASSQHAQGQFSPEDPSKGTNHGIVDRALQVLQYQQQTSNVQNASLQAQMELEQEKASKQMLPLLTVYVVRNLFVENKKRAAQPSEQQVEDSKILCASFRVKQQPGLPHWYDPLFLSPHLHLFREVWAFKAPKDSPSERALSLSLLLLIFLTILFLKVLTSLSLSDGSFVILFYFWEEGL